MAGHIGGFEPSKRHGANRSGRWGAPPARARTDVDISLQFSSILGAVVRDNLPVDDADAPPGAVADFAIVRDDDQRAASLV